MYTIVWFNTLQLFDSLDGPGRGTCVSCSNLWFRYHGNTTLFDHLQTYGNSSASTLGLQTLEQCSERKAIRSEMKKLPWRIFSSHSKTRQHVSTNARDVSPNSDSEDSKWCCNSATSSQKDKNFSIWNSATYFGTSIRFSISPEPDPVVVDAAATNLAGYTVQGSVLCPFKW